MAENEAYPTYDEFANGQNSLFRKFLLRDGSRYDYKLLEYQTLLTKSAFLLTLQRFLDMKYPS